MSLAIDMTGQTIGRLKVMKVDPSVPRNRDAQGVYWLCVCKCGEMTSVRGTALRSGHIKSCGCLRRDFPRVYRRNLLGRVFGMLRVIRGPLSGRSDRRWVCQCECGTETTIRMGLLVSGNTKSCGCGQSVKRKRSRIAEHLPRSRWAP